MPVSLRLLDATAAGTQTLRLVTALVCSVSVTTAVAGPMAYRAIEFRNAVDDSAAVVVVDDPTRVPAFAVERAVLDPDSRFGGLGTAAVDAASTAASAELSATSAVPGAVGTTTSAAAGASTTSSSAPSDLPPAAVPTVAPPASAAPPAVPVPAATPGPTAGAVAGTGATPATVQVTPTSPAPAAATTAPPNNALDEFNPRRACDDESPP